MTQASKQDAPGLTVANGAGRRAGPSRPAEEPAVTALIMCVIHGDVERARRWIHVAGINDYQATFMYLVKMSSRIPRLKTMLEMAREERRNNGTAVGSLHR